MDQCVARSRSRARSQSTDAEAHSPIGFRERHTFAVEISATRELHVGQPTTSNPMRSCLGLKQERFIASVTYFFQVQKFATMLK